MTQNSNVRCVEMLMFYHRNPTLSLRNQLVQLNRGLVRQVAHRMSHQCSEPYEDLEQTGYLGLIQAIERFDPHQGCAFSSFAIPYIRGEMLHFLRDKASVMKIPRHWQELHNKGKILHQQLLTQLGRPPEDWELAQALGISPERWYECELALQNRSPMSLDVTIIQAMDCVTSFGETLTDEQDQIQQSLEEERLQLQKALSQLEGKTLAAIEFVFFRELPRKEAAKHIGISPMTVTRHLQKGIEQLSVLLKHQIA
jgi:RNA polymerase sigma-B factor